MTPPPGASPECVELVIDALAAGGDGVGRCPDGRAIFVPQSAPGDRVRVRLTERRARYARGEIEALLSPGPGRVAPLCPVFGVCGGCAWQHLDYALQVEAKRAILRDALVRIAKLAPPQDPPPLLASPRPYAYRLRARVLAEGGRIGYRRRRSAALCATTSCPILLPQLERHLAELAAGAARSPARGRARREIELLAGPGGAARAVTLPARRGDRVELPLAGDRILVSPGTFAQANAFLLEPLVDAVHAAAGGGARALELYAGAGLFTLGLARRFGRLVAVEADRGAARDLAANLRRAGLGNAEVRCAPVEHVLERGDLAEPAPDAIVLDPPRAGLPRGAPQRLAALRPARIVYLSCDPATLARDLAGLSAAGYALERVEGFDLFPQTPHVEALALLRAAPAG